MRIPPRSHLQQEGGDGVGGRHGGGGGRRRCCPPVPVISSLSPSPRHSVVVISSPRRSVVVVSSPRHSVVVVSSPHRSVVVVVLSPRYSVVVSSPTSSLSRHPFSCRSASRHPPLLSFPPPRSPPLHCRFVPPHKQDPPTNHPMSSCS